MDLDIRSFFSEEAIRGTLQRLPELASPTMDFLFPPSKRISYPSPTIPKDRIGNPATNIQLSRRGSGSLAVVSPGSSVDLIEPQPVNPRTFLGAAEMNNMLRLKRNGQQQMIDEKIDFLRQVCRQTAEALSAQSLTGAISYPMKMDGADTTFTLSYGTISSVTVSPKFDAVGAKVGDVVKALTTIAADLKKRGYGIDVKFICGDDVYAALVSLVGALNNSAVASVTADGISFGSGLQVKYLPANYKDLATGNVVSAIPAKTIIAIDMAARHELFYASLDDLDANFVAMPFFAKPIKKDDPSGYDIVGASKPLPTVNTKAMAKAVVLT